MVPCDPHLSLCCLIACLLSATYTYEKESDQDSTTEGIIIHLYCRQDDYLVLTWKTNYSLNTQETIIYMVEKIQLKVNHSWIHTGQTEKKLMKITGLKENETYCFRITPMLNNISIGPQVVSQPFSTLSYSQQPKKITDIEVSKMFQDSSLLMTVLIWHPTEDAVCLTELLIYHEGSNQIQHIYEIKIENLYNYPLQNLLYSEKYIVELYNVVGEEEGEHSSMMFTTPSCLEATSNDINLCIPETPVNLQVDLDATDCQVAISWSEPVIAPLYYNMYVYLISHTPYMKTSIPGNVTSFYLRTDNFRRYFKVALSAMGPKGESGVAEVATENSCYSTKDLSYPLNELERENTILHVLTTLSPALLVLFALYLIFVLRSKKRKIILDDIVIKEKVKETKNTIVFEDEYEIRRDKLYICHLLGEGEFGVVHKALYTTEDKTQQVAVKTVRKNGTSEEKRQLQKEMEVMKSVGKHKNIVSLVGCCTLDMMLIVEYCSRGDLHNYLRKVWSTQIWFQENRNSRILNEKYENIKNIFPNKQLAVSNILYENSESNRKKNYLTFSDLLSFARQIALGMEYLSANRVIHRDLAARNVLLCDDMSVKISDFGLSRDIYEYSIYRKSSCDKLPLKWMAIESLLYLIFTSKSDVWSFGVLLWEIMTLAACPYPSIPSREMLRLLQEGYRMEKPSSCSQSLYEVMLACWDAQPHNRPSFSELIQKLDFIIDSEYNEDYLEPLI